MVNPNPSDPRPPVSLAVAILFIFFVLGLICLWIPLFNFFEMIAAIHNKSVEVEINKGSYYLFGAGVSLMALLPDGFCNAVLRRKVPAALVKWGGRAAVAGIILMLLLPSIIHYPSAKYLESSEYSKCQDKSRQWLFVSTIVYTKPHYCD